MQHRVAIANRREISKMVDNINTNLWTGPGFESNLCLQSPKKSFELPPHRGGVEGAQNFFGGSANMDTILQAKGERYPLLPLKQTNQFRNIFFELTYFDNINF
jgi:hypothetical protein